MVLFLYLFYLLVVFAYSLRYGWDMAMLDPTNYIKEFKKQQSLTVNVTRELMTRIKPGMSELQIAHEYESLLAKQGLMNHWYPIIICSGSNTGKPISRRIHLPSSDTIVQENDILFIDSTPMEATVWSNWCKMMLFGHNEFFQQLINDSKEILRQTALYARDSAKTIGDVYDFCNNLIQTSNMTPLDPRNDVGHSIFQIEPGQTVDTTPMNDRLFISEEYHNSPLKGIISIEPQVGRINPLDGIMYGSKVQEVIIFS